MIPPQETNAALIRWIILREEVRDRARETAQCISSRVRKALEKPDTAIPLQHNDNPCQHVAT